MTTLPAPSENGNQRNQIPAVEWPPRHPGPRWPPGVILGCAGLALALVGLSVPAVVVLLAAVVVLLKSERGKEDEAERDSTE